MSTSDQTVVAVMSFEGDKIVREIPATSTRNAEIVDRALQHNLNHDLFYSRTFTAQELSEFKASQAQEESALRPRPR